MKNKIGKLSYTKIKKQQTSKTFCALEDTISKVKRKMQDDKNTCKPYICQKVKIHNIQRIPLIQKQA